MPFTAAFQQAHGTHRHISTPQGTVAFSPAAFSLLQEVLGHLGRQQLGQLLQEMIVAMHGIAAYPQTPSDGQACAVSS